MSAGVVDRLLRTPGRVAEACLDGRESGEVARAALVVIVAGAALFGAVVGSWRGGAQIAFAALKLPLVSIATLAVCMPAFFVLTHVFGRPWPLRAVVSLMLAAGARLSLVLLAAAPAVWLVVNLGASYPAVKLLAAALYGLAGIAALALLVRGLGAERGRAAIVSLFVGIFMLTGGQVAWVLRPYIGMPDRSKEVALFTREREGGLVYQLFVAAGEVLDPRAARGER